MDALVQTGLSNALVATVMAVLVAGFGRLVQRPALVHCLWLLVLLKLITPPFLACPMPRFDASQPKSARPIPPALAILPPALRDEPVETAGAPSAEVSRLELAEFTNDASNPSPPIEASEKPAPALEADDLAVKTAVIVDGSSETSPRLSIGPYLPLLETIWLAGSILWFAFVVRRVGRFRRWLRCARPAPAELCAQVQRLAHRLDLKVPPALAFLPARISPMVWPLGRRPQLFVPSALWERLNEDQRAALLVHELAHLRRGDQWVRGLELLVSGLFWWHPVVWWARRELREAEEQCCDAWVVWTLPRAARAYAAALLEAIDFVSETPSALPAVASGISHVHDLRRRLTMIMHGKTPHALSAAGLVVVLALGAFWLPLRATWAQDDPRIQREIQLAEEQRRAADEARAEAENARRRELQNPDDIQGRIDSERNRFLAVRQKLASEVESMKANLERAMVELKHAEEQLNQFENRSRATNREAVRQQIEGARQQEARAQQRADNARQELSRRHPNALAGREQMPDGERRLADLEKKLDALLAEVQSLRREMRRPGPTPEAAPTMPGARPSVRPRGELPRGPFPAPAVAPATAPVAPQPPRTPAPALAPPAPVAPAPVSPPDTVESLPRAR